MAVAVAPVIAQEKPEAPPAPPAPGAAPTALQVLVNPQSLPAPCPLYIFRFMQPRGADILARELKLTDEQKSKVAEVLTKFSEDLQPKVTAQRSAGAEFAAAVANPESTPAAITAAADKVMKAELDIVSEDAKTLQTLRGMLTPEQAELFRVFLDRYGATYRPRTATAPMPAPPAAPARAAEPAAAH